MKRIFGCALIAMALGGVGAPVMGQFAPGPPGFGPADVVYRVQQTQVNLRLAEAEVDRAIKARDAKKRMVDQGLAPQSDLQTAEAELMRAQANVELMRNQLKQQETELQQITRDASLRRPASVELRDSPVRQAAQTLSQASGITINVDKSVPTDKRLTVVAQDVPLATILDTIARQTGLLIAPEGNGVLLKLAPTLSINGQQAALMSSFAPWSDEWGTNPAANLGEIGGYRTVTYSIPGGGVAQRVVSAYPPGTEAQPPGSGSGPLTPYVQTPNGAPMATGPDGTIIQEAPRPAVPVPGFGSAGAPSTPSPGPVYGGFGGSGIGGFGGGGLGGPGGGGFGGGGLAGYEFAASGPPPVTMTALSSNTFVVANPAAGPQGEPAVMLTVYRLEGTALRKVSSVLHRLGPAGGRRGGAVGFGQPGGVGMGEFGGGGLGGGFGGGGFGAPGVSPKDAPGLFPNGTVIAPRSSAAPGEAPQPAGAGALNRPDGRRAPAPANTAPTPTRIPPATDSAPARRD